MKKLIFLFFVCFAIAEYTFAQGLAVNTTGANPNPSAILDVSDTSKGVLIPRMTMAQRNAIPSPANSLMVFVKDSASRGYYYYDSITTSWVKVGDQLLNQQDSCLSLIPQPAFPVEYTYNIGLSSDTIVNLGQIVIPFDVKAYKITFIRSNVFTPGKIKIGLYRENGQKFFEIETDTIISPSTQAIVLTLPTPVNIKKGLYYLAAMPVGNAQIQLASYYEKPGLQLLLSPASGNTLSGYINVPSSTLPINFDPSTINYSVARCIIIRIN